MRRQRPWATQAIQGHFLLPSDEKKEEGGSGWESRRWLEGMYEDMSINIARSNYAMLAERTTPPGVRPAE